MKTKLLMVLILMLSAGMVAALNVQMDVQVTNGATENADTIFANEPSTFDIFFANDDTVGGYSNGFVIWTNDFAGWDYDTAILELKYIPPTQPPEFDTIWKIVTVEPGSRQDAPALVWDNGSLEVLVQDTVHIYGTAGEWNVDSILFGGTRKDNGMVAGPLEKQILLHFTAWANGTMCIDSTKIGPAGDFVFSDVAGTTFVPEILWPEGGKCWPVRGGLPADESQPAMPMAYGLDQNFPNPFNPSTTLHYSLAKKGQVNLVVYNVLGQHVRTLVDAEQEASEYDVVWNGDDQEGHGVASGIYFYRLITDNFVATKKMMLMR